MARWKLASAHYLNVPGTQWEYKEAARTRGKAKKAMFDVPLFLDPNDPQDWNWVYDRDSGDIIICHEGKGDEKDIVFAGDPTPDMVPLDDEAKAISAQFESRWGGKAIDMPERGYTEVLLADLGQKLAEAQVAHNQPVAAGMDKLLETLNAMMQQNAQLIATLATQNVSSASGRRI
jgi:hypothetical protein